MNIDSAIKSINERMKTIDRTFGANSKIANDYRSRVMSQFKSTDYYYNDKGTLQIKRGKAVAQSKGIENKVEFIKRLPTATKLTQRIKERIKSETGRKNVSKSEAIVAYNVEQTAAEIVRNHLDLLYKTSSNGVKVARNEKAAEIINVLRKSANTTQEISEQAQAIEEYFRLFPEHLNKDTSTITDITKGL